MFEINIFHLILIIQFYLNLFKFSFGANIGQKRNEMTMAIFFDWLDQLIKADQ